MEKSPILYALILSFALLVAILSIPEILESFANGILHQLGAELALLAVFIIGIVHGIKPDIHTWPITIPYAIGQPNIKKALLTTVVFTSALTLIWTILSAITSSIYSLVVNPENISPYADIFAGTTMMLVGLLFIRKSKKEIHGKAPDFKYIWIHGIGAAFGGDFFVVLVLVIALSGIFINPMFGFLVGLLFGLGTMVTQLIIVYFSFHGFKLTIKDTDTLAKTGTYSLFILGLLLIIFAFMPIK